MSSKLTLDEILTNRFRKDEMLNYLSNNPDEINQVLSILLSGKTQQAWRCAWLIAHHMDFDDPSIRPIIDQLITALDNKKDGYQREILKILFKMELSDEQEGRLFNICMTIWESVNKSPSVRITAFKFLIQTVKKHPELKNEIDFLTQEQYTDTLSTGIKHSFKKLIASL